MVPPNWESTNKGWRYGNCRMCVINGESRPDTKRRGGFHFHEDGFTYNCFNCGFSTGWGPGSQLSTRTKQLLKGYGADEVAIHRLIIELMRENEAQSLIHRLVETPTDTPVTISWETRSLPTGTMLFSDFNTPTQEWIDAATYIADRGLDPVNQFMYCPSKKPAHLDKRVVIPYKFKGEIVGYTARWVDDDVPPYVSKYHRDAPEDFVFNLDAQNSKSKYVIVTEGDIDALSIDAVSVCGNTISDDQSKIIEQLGKTIILLPDFDKAGKVAVDTAIERGWYVSFPPWEDGIKDANQAMCKYGKLFTVKSIIDFATNNKTKIEVMARQHCK